MPQLPPHLVYPLEQFADDFLATIARGQQLARTSHIHFTGLARDCAGPLAVNLSRVLELVEHVGVLSLHIEENDSTDETPAVLAAFQNQHAWASARSRVLCLPRRGNEFAGPRTVQLAEFRSECQRMAPKESDFVVVMDFDAAGSFLLAGLFHGLGVLGQRSDVSCSASVSLARTRVGRWDGQATTVADEWIHYDAWALRLNSTFDDYRAGMGTWKHSWLPPVGSPPIPVASAFGGLAIYRTPEYLAGVYEGSDCEHVTFHTSIPGVKVLNPSQRCIMSW